MNLNIKKARENAGLSQKEIAITLHVSPPTVSEWESGKKTPTAKNLFELAKICKVSIDFLLGYGDKFDYSNMFHYENIGRAIAMSRMKAGLDMSQAANAINISQDQLSDWECGYSRIPSSTLFLLLQKYRADIYEFMYNCDILNFCGENDDSGFWISEDVKEVANAYSCLDKVETKNMIRGALQLPPIKEIPVTEDFPEPSKIAARGGMTIELNDDDAAVTSETDSPLP